MTNDRKKLNPTDTTSIGDIFEIDIEHYANAYIPEQNLTNRTINCLMRSNITTVRTLPNCSPSYLMSVNYFGITSLRDVESFVRPLKSRYESVEIYEEQIFALDFSFIEHAKLTTDARGEISVLQQLKLENPDCAKRLCQESSTIQDLIEKAFKCLNAHKRELIILEDISRIPRYRLLMPIKALLAIGEPNASNHEVIAKIAGGIDMSVETFCNAAVKCNDYADITDPFIRRLSYNLPNEIAEIMKICCRDDRGKRVLYLRMNGATLEKIAKSYNITRERVRQIERTIIQNFRTMINKLKIVDKLSIEIGKDRNFTKEEILSIPNSTDAFYHCLKIVTDVCSRV